MSLLFAVLANVGKSVSGPTGAATNRQSVGLQARVNPHLGSSAKSPRSRGSGLAFASSKKQLHEISEDKNLSKRPDNQSLANSG